MISLKQRMYSIVLRHLSGIQKGIQASHSQDEYKIIHGEKDEYRRWLETDKTVVILETDSTELLNNARLELAANEVSHSIFTEEDLGDIITAISFVVDEKVWDFEAYPNCDFQPILTDHALTKKEIFELKEKSQYEANVLVYGEKTAFLKQFIKKFRLATN